MEILIANGAVVITLSRHRGSAKMTAEMVSIIGVGVATVSLGVATISLTWRMNSTLRQEMTDSFKEVRRDVADLRERMARLEGTLDGFMGRREESA